MEIVDQILRDCEELEQIVVVKKDTGSKGLYFLCAGESGSPYHLGFFIFSLKIREVIRKTKIRISVKFLTKILNPILDQDGKKTFRYNATVNVEDFTAEWFTKFRHQYVGNGYKNVGNNTTYVSFFQNDIDFFRACKKWSVIHASFRHVMKNGKFSKLADMYITKFGEPKQIELPLLDEEKRKKIETIDTIDTCSVNTEVKLARFDGHPVVVKVYHLDPSESHEDQFNAISFYVYQHLEMYERFPKNISKIEGYYHTKSENTVSVLMRYTGRKVSDRKEKITICKPELLLRLFQTLSEFHEVGIVHGNIKGNNIFLTNEDVPVFSDFHSYDLWQMFKNRDDDNSKNIVWCASEQFDRPGTRTEIGDIYSLGVAVCELIYGNIRVFLPDECFEENDEFVRNQFCDMVEEGFLAFEWAFEHIPTNWRKVLKKCITYNTKRLTAKEMTLLLEKKKKGLIDETKQMPPSVDVLVSPDEIEENTFTGPEEKEQSSAEIEVDIPEEEGETHDKPQSEEGEIQSDGDDNSDTEEDEDDEEDDNFDDCAPPPPDAPDFGSLNKLSSKDGNEEEPPANIPSDVDLMSEIRRFKLNKLKEVPPEDESKKKFSTEGAMSLLAAQMKKRRSHMEGTDEKNEETKNDETWDSDDEEDKTGKITKPRRPALRSWKKKKAKGNQGD